MTLKRVLFYTAMILPLIMSSYGESAALHLPAIFSSNMVVQRDKSIHVWGTVDANQVVRVEFAGQSVETAAHDDSWEVWLDPVKAGGPYELNVYGAGQQRTYRNVMVGDVWIASGQSNMVLPLHSVTDGASELTRTQQQEAKKLANSQIRLFKPTVTISDHPLSDHASPGWMMGSFDQALTFSAVGFYFAGYLQQSLGVPIGIVQVAKGSTPAQTWMSTDAFQTSEQLRRIQQTTEKIESDIYNKPAALYNGLIAPLHKFPVKGVIWYQGESNGGIHNPVEYGTLMTALINDWRQKWRDQLPFLTVQLTGYGKNDLTWATLRDEQRKVAIANNKVGMAVTIDVGERNNIHPIDKLAVGYRLALQARCLVYGANIVCSGPTLERAERQDDEVFLTFKDVGSGLTSNGKKLASFQLCNESGYCTSAEATIEGRQVVLWSSEIAEPTTVRYAWSDFPEASLFNRDGLPAGPFNAKVEQGSAQGHQFRHIRLIEPLPDAVIAGEVPIQYQGVDNLVVKQVDVKVVPANSDDVNEQLHLYSGSALPDQLKLDTLQLADGHYELLSNVVTIDGKSTTISRRISVDNWVVLEDDVEAPIVGGWFGTVNRMRTEAATNGWEFKGGKNDILFDDIDRISRKVGTEESLTWKLPRLRRFAFTVYAQSLELASATKVAVSADTDEWTLVAYEVKVQEQSDTGWSKVLIEGIVPSEVRAEYIRYTIHGNSIKSSDLQLGHVLLLGTSDSYEQRR